MTDEEHWHAVRLSAQSLAAAIQGASEAGLDVTSATRGGSIGTTDWLRVLGTGLRVVRVFKDTKPEPIASRRGNKPDINDEGDDD